MQRKSVLGRFFRLSLMLLGVCTAGENQGQTVWNVNKELPPAVYTSPNSPIWICGGDIARTEKGLESTGGQTVQASIASGSDVSGVVFHLSNGILLAKGCGFTHCRFIAHKKAAIAFDNCLLTGCTLVDEMPEEHPAADDRFKITLTGCVIKPDSDDAQTEEAAWYLGDPRRIVTRWERCSFLGGYIGAAFTHGTPEDVPSLVTEGGGYVRSCHFKVSKAPVELLAVSDGCTFEGVIFDWSAVSKTLSSVRPEVRAHITPVEQLIAIKRYCPRVLLIPMEETVPGAMVNNGGMSPPLNLVTGSPTLLASVLATYNSDPFAVPMSSPTGAAPPAWSAPDVALKTNTSSVHGLLIVSLDRGEAGSASRMSAIALDHDKSLSSEVRFNQPVGDMMSKALAEVNKFIQLKNKGWPKGYKIELSFADKYSGKDGPSAAVACALLLNSLITGKANDPSFAVTGDMNADGTVQPIGGVAAKIRGATGGKCKIVAIPDKNEKSLGDLLLTDGPAPFVGIQIYSISHFDEAEALALTDRPPQVQEAINQMQQVQDVLLRNKAQMGGWLKNPHVIAKLQAVLQAAPNHLSAKYLLMYGTGKIPTTLSLAGSIDAVEHAAAELIAAIKANKGQDANALRKDVVGSSITRLQNLRARCDMRVRAYADAIIRYGSIIKDAQDRPANSASRYNQIMASLEQSVGAVQSEWKNLINNPQVREELEE